MNPLQNASDEAKRAVRYVSYAIIAGYGILTGDLLATVAVIALFQILTELKRHRAQRALMFEQEHGEEKGASAQKRRSKGR